MKEDREKENSNVQYLKLQRQGGSKVLAISKFLPSTWKLVSVSVLAEDEGSRTLKISRIR